MQAYKSASNQIETTPLLTAQTYVIQWQQHRQQKHTHQTDVSNFIPWHCIYTCFVTVFSLCSVLCGMGSSIIWSFLFFTSVNLPFALLYIEIAMVFSLIVRNMFGNSWFSGCSDHSIEGAWKNVYKFWLNAWQRCEWRDTRQII